MSFNIINDLPESGSSGLNLEETELTLGLPGGTQQRKPGTKRGFSDFVELKLGQFENDNEREGFGVDDDDDEETPPPKAQVVGWPPVRTNRKNITIKNCKYVKVAVDGAPYLRKVDLELCSSYHHLLNVFENMFSCLTIRNVLNEKKIVDTNGSEYVATYEDKDGDWMLVGDVPWKMFVESCKKMRLMTTSSKAIGLAPRTPSKSLTASC